MYLPEEQSYAEEVKKAIEKTGRVCLLLPLDLTVRANAEEAVRLHMATHGALDVLVNNSARRASFG